MGFDVENFGLGLLVGWATGYGVYRARHRIGAAVRAVRQQAESAQNFATQSADSRYVNDLVNLAETAHLAGRFIKLSQIVVEPRFLPSPPLAAPPDEDVRHTVFHVVPIVPDHPYLHAPYNVETLSIDGLSQGERRIALLGRPGSGRTTALMTIILRSLGRVRFDPPVDKVQQRIDAEDAALTDKQRAVRIKERLTIEQRAKERLAEEQGLAYDSDVSAKTSVMLFNRLMPVYVPLADIDPTDPELGKTVDPAEPLVRAVQRQVGRVTASTIPRLLYNRLSKGQALLLVDGYDELPQPEREQKLNWLAALLDAYPDNFYIAAGPVEGYGPLARLGLNPVFLRPWADLDCQQAADRWAAAWPRAGLKRREKPAELDAGAVARAKTGSRALAPFDLSLKIWGNYASDTEAPGLEGWLRAFITRHLPAEQSLGLILPQLTAAAVLQLDAGYITQAQLEQHLTGMAIAFEAGSDEPDDDDAPKSKKARKSGADKDKKEDSSAAAKFLTMLRRSGLLARYTGGRYRFAHSSLAAYLASLSLKEGDKLAEKALLPEWSPAIAYAALHTPLDEAVRIRLAAPPDVLASQTLEVAHWLANAGGDVSWRATYLKTLGTMMASPAQYPCLRERAAAALLSTRDRNAALFFRASLKSSQPHLRGIAALALGALGEPEVINDLLTLLNDPNEDVQLAAGLGLGAVGTEAALEALVDALTQGSEPLRQAVAETFAAIPEEGYPILYDAIRDDDMMLRRAAVFGLRRIKAGWSLIAIYRAFLEDSQWYVRSAAQIAFQELQYGGERGVYAYPPAEELTWLAEWAAKRGENLPTGEGANQMLMRALQEGDPNTRRLAAAVIGQMGLASIAKALYGVLRDRQDTLRDTAHRALANLQARMGQPLPAPL